MKTSPVLLNTSNPSSVLIPGKGFFIFGGNNNKSSQHLSDINGTWDIGDPKVFNSTVNSYTCVVQV